VIRNPLSQQIVTILATVVLASAPLESAERTSEWLTGRDFRQKLTQPATVLCADSPLREYLSDFGRAQRAAILLDRRIDPDQMLTLAVRDESVLAIIQAVASSRDLRAAVLRNVIYVGTPASADRIRTVTALRRQEIDALGSEASLKFSRQAPIAWQDLDSPRNLLGELAKESGLDIVNPEQVPHDLWEAGELPPMSLAERLTLILHQFDLTFRVAADACRVAVVPLPQDVAIVRDYPGGSKPEMLAQKWRNAYPDCEFRIAGNRIHVRGLVEDLEAIETTGASGGRQTGKPRGNGKPEPPSEQVFTANVPDRPLGAVLAHFAKQLGLELQIDQASLQSAGVSLEQSISFHVEDATFDELFQAALAPVGCVHERQGNVLKVRAKH
jgi:hypothetical protein